MFGRQMLGGPSSAWVPLIFDLPSAARHSLEEHVSFNSEAVTKTYAGRRLKFIPFGQGHHDELCIKDMTRTCIPAPTHVPVGKREAHQRAMHPTFAPSVTPTVAPASHLTVPPSVIPTRARVPPEQLTWKPTSTLTEAPTTRPSSPSPSSDPTDIPTIEPLLTPTGLVQV